MLSLTEAMCFQNNVTNCRLHVVCAFILSAWEIVNIYSCFYLIFYVGHAGLENNSETSKKPLKAGKGTATKRSSVDNDSSTLLPDKKLKPDPKPPKKSKLGYI